MLFLDEFGKGWKLFLIGISIIPVLILLQYLQSWELLLIGSTSSLFLIGVGLFFMFTKPDEEQQKYRNVQEEKGN